MKHSFSKSKKQLIFISVNIKTHFLQLHTVLLFLEHYFLFLFPFSCSFSSSSLRFLIYCFKHSLILLFTNSFFYCSLITLPEKYFPIFSTDTLGYYALLEMPENDVDLWHFGFMTPSLTWKLSHDLSSFHHSFFSFCSCSLKQLFKYFA